MADYLPIAVGLLLCFVFGTVPLVVQQYRKIRRGAAPSPAFPWPRKRLREIVRNYRPLGFLKGHENLSDKELAEYLAPISAGVWGSTRDSWADDIAILATIDHNRFVCHDIDTEIEPYAFYLNEWIRITSGLLPMKDITAWWMPSGGVLVSLKLAGRRHTIELATRPREVNLTLIDRIAELLPPRMNLLFLDAGSVGQYSIMVSNDQRSGLEALGWRFLDGKAANDLREASRPPARQQAGRVMLPLSYFTS